MLLGRRLLTPLRPAASSSTTADTTLTDAALQRIQLNDRFFCETMESIPPQYYFPTDEEENWLKHQPKSAKKYHRDVMAQNVQESTKNAVKRAKFTPSEHKTNEARQLEAAADEKRLKQLAKQQPKAPTVAITSDKNPSATSLDGLKERLQKKIEAHRAQRNADDASGVKRKAAGENKNDQAKKRKTNGTASVGSAFNSNNKATSKKENATDATAVKEDAAPSSSVDAAPAISYGSLLLADDKKPIDKRTRNGQGIRGIKNLLKKAEQNQQRMEQLKQTDEGKAVVEAKQWSKAIKQAAGDVVIDDPKLLRNKLKKKEKAKAKSSKEWKQRIATVEIAKKEKQKKRMGNIKGGRHAAADARLEAAKEKTKGRKGPRAGFEGKKGESFLNGADEKKGKKKQ